MPEYASFSADRLGRLVEAGLALSAELSLSAVLQRIVDLAAEITDARYGALGVLNDLGGIEEFITTGLTQEERETIGALPEGLGLLGELTRESHAQRVRDISKHPQSAGFPPNHPKMTSFLGAPMTARGRVFGRIYLTEKRSATEFTEDDESALNVLASQAAVAIENARLYEEATAARRELERLAVMEDRERIAKELHDGAIQALFAVGMGLQGVSQLAADPDTARRIEEAVEDIDRVIRDLRNYIFGLRPGILADRQLDQALKQLVTDFGAKSSVTTVADIDPEVASELAPRAADIVQLTREALSNVGRHSGAATCRVSLGRRSDNAVLEIDDDGTGFDTGGPETGSGLGNMRERARGFGGEVLVESSPGEGTSISVTIPL